MVMTDALKERCVWRVVDIAIEPPPYRSSFAGGILFILYGAEDLLGSRTI